MKLKKLSFKDKTSEWSLESISFEKLTLLVGASGVGKTQILNAIFALKKITEGSSISGIFWEVEFETIDNKNYRWLGEYENKGFQFTTENNDELSKNKPKILKEELYLENVKIVQRTDLETYFNNQKTLKLSTKESIISILKEEDLIKPVFEGFKNLIFSDQVESKKEPMRISLFNVNKLAEKYINLKEIQELDEDIKVKLYLASKNVPKTFNQIKERFCEIFPQVEDLKIETLDLKNEEVPSFFREYPFIQIKEFGVNKWIQQGKISSGMFRSLIQISEMYLCPEGTIFLIDEFENSLGINCIDELTNDIINSKRQIQFIITSHHPYIINNIHYSKWKLVTRKSGVVKTHNLDEFISGKSKHDYFMQLIQLEPYQTGMEVE